MTIIFEPPTDSEEEEEDTLLTVFLGACFAVPPETQLLKDLIQSNPDEFQKYAPVLIRSSILQSSNPLSLLEIMFEAGASPNAMHEGRHPIVQAAKSGKVDLVKFLLSKGCDPEAMDRYNYPYGVRSVDGQETLIRKDAEEIAVSEGHTEMAEVIHQAKHKKPSRHYNNIIQLVASVHQKSDERVLQRLQEELRHENNKCLGCRTPDDKTLVEVLCSNYMNKSIQFLVSRNIPIEIKPDHIIADIFSARLTPEMIPIIVDLCPNILSLTYQDCYWLEYLIIQVRHFQKAKQLMQIIESLAKTESTEDYPVIDMSTPVFMGGHCTIVYLACASGNLEIVRSVIHMLDVLSDTKKSKHTTKQVINYVHTWDIGHDLWPDVPKLALCLPLAMKCKKDSLEITNLLLKHGADPNLKFAARRKSSARTSPISFHVSEMLESPNNLELVQLLMDYGAKDEEEMTLFTAQSAGDENMRDLILLNSWPAIPDNYHCHNCNNKTLIPKSEFVKELKERLSEFGYEKSPLADNKVLFNRRSAADLFPDYAASTSSNGQTHNHHQHKFILEPLQLAFTQLNIYKKIDSELAIKAVLHFFRQMKMDEMLTRHEIRHSLTLDLLTTIKIENCATFDTLDPVFFTGCYSLKHLMVTNNKMLKHLPRKVDISRCIIEYLQLEKNGILEVPNWIFSMQNLKALNLAENKLKTLPVEMWLARSLEDLDLSRNEELKKLPESNLMSSSLSNLNTSRIQKLSENSMDGSFSGADSMEYSCVSEETLYNFKLKWKKLSVFEKKYTASKDVRLTPNMPVGDPENINGLQLRTLTLTSCGLTSLPKNLACLAPRLAYLNCKKNKIEKISIPEQFPPNIVRLEFESNNLCTIHSFCDSAFLCLRNNDTSLHQDESMDTNDRNEKPYKEQWVQRCRHTSHERLENLQSLDLSHNPRLKRVHFDYNMETKDKHIIASTRLPGLSNLFLNDCALTEISDSITRLKMLRWLAVSNNPGITTIPEDLAQLEKLFNFHFDGCNISDDVLRGIADKGSATKEVIRYLSAKREGKEPWKRMKLMFMGESEAGKTSMVRAMARCAASSSTNKYQGVMRYAVRQHMLDTEQIENERNEPPLSTVGVDIGDWVYPLENNLPHMQQIWFDTWDFAGQEVFQITHQYFITRRCVFVLVFNLVKRQYGKYVIRANDELFRELKKWLNNIYCRIPNAHFLLVGTRKDLARAAVGDDPNYFELIKQFLFDKLRRFDEQYDNKSSGFPIIEDILFVTLVNGREEEISTLSNSIWRVAANMKPELSGPDKNRNLIDIEVPQRYRVVENWFRLQKQGMRERNEEPVLTGDVLEQRINAHLASKNMRKLDPHEFSSMMRFMHENGIILNYDSVFLSDKYFTDPQWLADQLAYVITIKEIQDYGSSGIVKIDDFLSKMKKIQALKNLRQWPRIFIPLLAQFEVALKFNDNYLLIPSSLPTEREHLDRYSKQWERDIQVQSIVQPDMPCFESVQKFHNRFKNKKISRDDVPEICRQNRRFSTYQVLNTANLNSDAASENPDDHEKVNLKLTLCDPSEMTCLAKVMVFSYIPFGFWARLLARIIADEQFAVNAASILVPNSKNVSPKLSYALNSGMAWRCWKTGLSLILWNHVPIIEVKEILSDDHIRHSPFSQNMESVRVCKQNLINATGHMGKTLNAGDPSQFPERVEFCETRLNKAFPKQTLTIKIFKPELVAYEEQQFHNHTWRESTYLHADNRTVAHFFEQISQHVDILLKEWYPNLGEDRFKKIGDHEHSIERVIPCPECLQKHDKPRILVKHLNLQFNVSDIIEHEQTNQYNEYRKPLHDWGASTDDSGLSSSDDSEEEKEKRHWVENEKDDKMTSDVANDKNGKKLMRANSLQAAKRRPQTTGGVETPNAEENKKLFKKIVRRYTTTIGGDYFDYSEDWHRYHGVTRPAVPRQPTQQINSGFDAISEDYDSESIISMDSIRRSTVGERFHMYSSARKQTSNDILTPKLHCFVEEEVLLLACSGETQLACPSHGEFFVGDVTPNFFFIDLPSDKVVPRKMFEIEKYLGYGCFGAVFSGFITDPLGRSNKKIKVANKFYQPIYLSENLKTPADSKAAILSKQQHWLQEPVITIADAYMELRKEMSVLMQLVNPYIVTFYGASLSPIALLLDIAPMGSLEDRLQAFREENAVLQPQVMREVTEQIALALVYLHQHAFVHRDLKPANVLVWKFSQPHQTTKQVPLHGSTLVKLADYGMAQKEIGEGMLGRPGTLQYMAPEILSNDGKDIYSHKIDVYSLGMIVYDLTCMTPPWMIPNFLDVRNLVLDDKRPPITSAANQNPVAFLDILTYCSLPDPRDRPSAQEVVDILKNQLCCKLIETVQLKSKFMYGVSNMGLSLVPGEGGPKAMQTIVIHSLDQYQTMACESVEQDSPIRQKLDLSFLYYKDVLRETMSFQSDLGYYTDNEIVSCRCPINNNFLLGTNEGSLIVLQVQDASLQLKHKRRVANRPIVKILKLEVSGAFSCFAIVTSENAALTFFKFSDELFNNGKFSSPVKLATLESMPIEKIHSACLLINKYAANFRDEHSSLSFSSRGSTDASSFASDCPSPTFNPIEVPDDLELWLSVQNSQIRRYLVKKSNVGRRTEGGNYLTFEATYPTLKFDPCNLFDGRLTAQQLVTLPEYQRVWAAGSESRYLYMWDLEALQLTTITCPTDQVSDDGISSSFLSSPVSPTMMGDRRFSTHVIQINDMKAFDGCIYVALSNGHVLVYHGMSGQQLNTFKSHSTTTFKILPLEPKINPPSTPIMQHYLQQMEQKDPRFLTFGNGTLDTVEQEFDKLRKTTFKQRKETMMHHEDRRYQTVKRPIIAKLWNTYGDVPDPRPVLTKSKSEDRRTPRLTKQQTLTNMTMEEVDAMLEYEESLRAVWLPGDEQHLTSRWTEEEMAHFSSFVQFEDPVHSLDTVTPSDDEDENDDMDDLPKGRNQRLESMVKKIWSGRKSASLRSKRGSQGDGRSVFYTNPLGSSLPATAAVKISKPISVTKTEAGGATFQNCMIQVNSDGFACHKFMLTTSRYKIEFSNGVVVEWKSRSIKNGCRSVFVLMTPPSETFVNKIQSSSTDPVHISPVVIILYEPRSLFVHPVTISFPLPKTGYNRRDNSYDLGHELFTGLEIFPGSLFPVNKLEEKFILDRNYIHYGSDEIYGPVFVISKNPSYEINRLDLRQLLPKSQLILLVIYKETTIERKMSFSCLDLDQCLEIVKMLPLKQIQIHGLRKMTSASNHRKIEINAFNRTVKLQTGEKEIRIAEEKNEPKRSSSDISTSSLQNNEVIYRFKELVGKRSQFEHETLGKIELWHCPTIKDQVINSVMRSIIRSGKNWDQLLANFSFDTIDIRAFAVLDCQDLLYKAVTILSEEETKFFLSQLFREEILLKNEDPTDFINEFYVDLPHTEAYTKCIEHFINKTTKSRNEIGQALCSVPRLKGLEFSSSICHPVAVKAAKILVEKFRFNKLSGKTADLAVLVHNSLNVFKSTDE